MTVLDSSPFGRILHELFHGLPGQEYSAEGIAGAVSQGVSGIRPVAQERCQRYAEWRVSQEGVSQENIFLSPCALFTGR